MKSTWPFLHHSSVSLDFVGQIQVRKKIQSAATNTGMSDHA